MDLLYRSAGRGRFDRQLRQRQNNKGDAEPADKPLQRHAKPPSVALDHVPGTRHENHVGIQAQIVSGDQKGGHPGRPGDIPGAGRCMSRRLIQEQIGQGIADIANVKPHEWDDHWHGTETVPQEMRECVFPEHPAGLHADLLRAESHENRNAGEPTRAAKAEMMGGAGEAGQKHEQRHHDHGRRLNPNTDVNGHGHQQCKEDKGDCRDSLQNLHGRKDTKQTRVCEDLGQTWRLGGGFQVIKIPRFENLIRLRRMSQPLQRRARLEGDSEGDSDLERISRITSERWIRTFLVQPNFRVIRI